MHVTYILQVAINVTSTYINESTCIKIDSLLLKLSFVWAFTKLFRVGIYHISFLLLWYVFYMKCVYYFLLRFLSWFFFSLYNSTCFYNNNVILFIRFLLFDFSIFCASVLENLYKYLCFLTFSFLDFFWSIMFGISIDGLNCGNWYFIERKIVEWKITVGYMHGCFVYTLSYLETGFLVQLICTNFITAIALG